MDVIRYDCLNIELRNSIEFPHLYVSVCGSWLHTSARPNYLVYYHRNKKHRYLKCCSAKHYLHRLVGFAWVYNPCPGVFTKIDHIDRDCQHNHARNLRWVTQQLNCLNRKVKGYEKIVKKHGAVFYRSRVVVEGNKINKFCRSKEEAMRETHRVQCESFDRLYKQHEERCKEHDGENGEVNNRAAHHFLWTDIRLDTPEGAVSDVPGVCRYREGRCAKFAVYDQSHITH